MGGLISYTFYNKVRTEYVRIVESHCDGFVAFANVFLPPIVVKDVVKGRKERIGSNRYIWVRWTFYE